MIELIKMDSKQENNDELIKYIDEINDRVWQIRGTPPGNFDPFATTLDILEKARSINYSLGVGRSLLNLGMGSFIIKNDKQQSFQFINEAFEVFKTLDDKKWIANAHLTLAILHNTLVNPELALYNGLRGISYFENNEGDPFDIIMGNYILGTIYKDLKKYDEAEKYYQVGILTASESNTSWLGRIYSSLANIYTHQAKYEQAIDLSLKSLEILKLEKNSMGESRALTDIGIIHRKQKKHEVALKFFFEGLKIRESQNLNQFVLTSLIEISTTYNENENYPDALVFLIKAEKIGIDLALDTKLITIYQEMANVYKSLNDFSSAVACYEKLFKISGEFHQKQLDVKISNLNSELIREKEAEIERLRNVELKAAYDIIELKNKEILESMRYASRIQKALLPKDKYIENHLKYRTDL